MHEPFDTRLWADHHQEIAASLHEFFHKIGEAFRKLSDIEFDAPWARPSSTVGR